MSGAKNTETPSVLAASEPGVGRQANAPRIIPARGWWRIAKRTVSSFFQDRVMLVSAGVTLYLLIALVPALSIVVSIYGLFSSPERIADQLSLMAGIVPAAGLEIIRAQLLRIAAENDNTLGLALLGALTLALWSASLGVKGLFEAMNVAYGEKEKRGFLHFNGLALLLTLGAAVLSVATITSVILLPAILSFAALEWITGFIMRIASFVLLAGFLVFGLAVLYRWGPSRTNAKWKWITPGAIFAIVSILVISIPFSWYVANFGNFSATYGSLGAIIGFLTWLWFSIIAVVMGAELNAETERQTAIDTTIPPERPMGHRGAYVADTLGD